METILPKNECFVIMTLVGIFQLSETVILPMGDDIDKHLK